MENSNTMDCECGGIFVNDDQTASHLVQCVICKKIKDNPDHDYSFLGFA